MKPLLTRPLADDSRLEKIERYEHESQFDSSMKAWLRGVRARLPETADRLSSGGTRRSSEIRARLKGSPYSRSARL